MRVESSRKIDSASGGASVVAEDQTPPLYARLLFWAIVFVPLQRAFTVDLGFPFKISETLIMIAVAAYLLAEDNRGNSRRHVNIGIESTLLGVLAALVVLSSAWRLMSPPPPGPYFGIDRSITIDLALYTFYAMLVLGVWAMVIRMDRERIEKALFLSVWVCLATSIMQLWLFQADQLQFLEMLNFQVEARAAALSGSGDDIPRSGPFVEGQHLGFYAGALIILCVIRKKWLHALAMVLCLIYSQSTSGFVGLVAGLMVVLLAQPKLHQILRLGAAGLVVGAVVASIPAGRQFIRFQLGKIGIGDGGGLTSAQEVSLSGDIRSVKTDIGFNIMWDHPFLGVGSGRYGVYFFDYPNDAIPDYYFRQDHRAIAENVYAQLGAELGLAALVVFLLFVIVTIRRHVILRVPTVALAVFVAVGMVTQSSWTFIPIWVLLGYLGCVWVGGRDGTVVRGGRQGSSRRSVEPTPLPNGRWE